MPPSYRGISPPSIYGLESPATEGLSSFPEKIFPLYHISIKFTNSNWPVNLPPRNLTYLKTNIQSMVMINTPDNPSLTTLGGLCLSLKIIQGTDVCSSWNEYESCWRCSWYLHGLAYGRPKEATIQLLQGGPLPVRKGDLAMVEVEGVLENVSTNPRKMMQIIGTQ